MLHRFLATTVLALMSVAMLAGSASAVERAKFDQAQFDAAKKAGKSIIVHVTAPWCPTCKAQKPIVDEIIAKPEYKDTVLLDVDFDSGMATMKSLNVRAQSTLIAMKGETETGRSVGVTKPEGIEELIKSAQ